MASKKSVTRNSSSKKSKSLVKNAKKEITENSFGQAIGFGGNAFGGGYGGNNPFAPQVEQVNTIFENLRWYFISNMRQPLSEAYVELGLVQTVVDVPVDDGLRGGVELSSKQLDESQIKELQISLDRDDDLNTAGQAAKWNRLYGGAGILIIVGDQDPVEPLNLAAINKNTSVEFRAVDMWELFWDKQNTEGYDPEIQTQEFETYNYYAEKIHKTRVMRLKGMAAPSFLRPRLRGWGFSVVEVLIRSINQYLKATDLSFECLDEFKVDVFKIKNLVNTLLSPQGRDKVAQRIAMANWQKNYQNALVMDSEDDWDHKQLSFSGIAETMQGIRMQVAADLRMPITKLFGTSASAGIGNTDQNDMENYNSMVEAQVRNKLKYDILRICEIKCQQLFGFIPDDLELEFKPLRVLTAEQEENVKTQKFNRVFQANQAGKMSDQEFRDACNRDNLLSIQLDTNEDLLNPQDPEVGQIVTEGEENPDKPVDTDDPGANREERRKPQAWDQKKPVTNQSQMPVNDAVDEAPPILGPEGNESDYDLMSYLAAGGDDWINMAQMQFYENPGNLILWERSKEASLKYLKSENLKYRIWWYRKQGGVFNAGSEPVSNAFLNLFKKSNKENTR
jgi:phage-related protein (TIGR01555 family)